MDISIGDEVMGTQDRLGELERVIVDARSRTVTDIVVKHGFVFGRERIVPIVHITRTEEGKVYLDLDEQGLEAMDGFATERRGPNPDYVGPPDRDLQGTYQGNMELDQAVAAGSAAGLGTPGKPMGYPGGEQLEQEFDQRPAIGKGTDVIANDGEKVGDLGEFSFDHDTGMITRLALRKGLLFKHDMEIPVGWLSQVGADGVVLNVPKGQVEAHSAATHDSRS